MTEGRGFLSCLFSPKTLKAEVKLDPNTIHLSDLNTPCYLMDRTFRAVHWNSKVCELYPHIPKQSIAAITCPCIELLTIAQGTQMLQCISDRGTWSAVAQERVLSDPAWSPTEHPNLIDETFTKLRCKAVVHTRMLYDLEVAGGVCRSFELTFKPTSGALILVHQIDVTFRVMQNYALFRLIDLNMGLLAQIYPSRFIHDILGAGERRNSLSFSPDDCKKYCEYHDNIVIMFADIVGFTQMCKGMQPLEIMDMLTLLYESYDKTLKQFPSLSKLEVVGDCYVAVGGLMRKDKSGSSAGPSISATATQMLDFALALQDIAASIERPPDRLRLRIGIHCGPVTSGIIGRTSCKFMLFGDAMNTASRMESTCPNGKIQTSQEFHDFVATRSGWTRTNGVVVKGKGEMVTYVHDVTVTSLLKPLRCDGTARTSRRSMGQLDLPELQHYPYTSQTDQANHPSWKVNLDLMLPTDGRTVVAE